MAAGNTSQIQVRSAAVKLLQHSRGCGFLTFLVNRRSYTLAVSDLEKPMSWIDKIPPSGVNKDDSATAPVSPKVFGKSASNAMPSYTNQILSAMQRCVLSATITCVSERDGGLSCALIAEPLSFSQRSSQLITSSSRTSGNTGIGSLPRNVARAKRTR